MQIYYEVFESTWFLAKMVKKNTGFTI